MSKPRLALLGLGNMGAGMANRLLSAQFPLTVFNRHPERAGSLISAGASVAGSPREAASKADIIISMVADDVASRSVWLGKEGAMSGASSGAVLIECSTLTVSWVRELASAAEKQGCEFLDAPVTGSKSHAANGELLFLVGGPATAVEKVRPVLSVLGRDVVHLGPTGSGAYLKLINNFLCGVQAASFAEALSMMRAGGLNVERAQAVLTNGAPGSPLVKAISARVASNDPTVNFSLRLMAKDLQYALEVAERNGISLQTAAPALEMFQRAIANGFAEKDFSAIINSLQPK
ncbi:MAG TPA: NAD(P)-dependent oxidoreductase [Candidatus Acidoferrales bacterium]|nr:NAD(P)-dependent oxidoreductase [Candidatus Acidoferrales bacterium]